VEKFRIDKFGYGMRSVNERNNYNDKEIGAVETFYVENFNCLRFLNTNMSK